MRADSPKTLEQLRESYKNALSLQKKKILICAGTGCVAGGSLKIYEQFKKLAEKHSHLVEVNLEAEKEGIGVKKSGCHGYCEMGPLVRIEPSGYLYL
ncbi:MAG TPA: NADH-quinone oxidoreductase subunit F, partial [Ruminiclostridium sp.]|nr:NADH-quinone oxidoreductase subunit F [Ruminiclostridium sp.]